MPHPSLPDMHRPADSRRVADGVSLLRITAWNCRQAFDRKAEMLAGLAADVAVVPESGPAFGGRDGAHWLRLGPEDGRGMGVSAPPPWTVTPRRTGDGPLLVHCDVDGPRPFRLLAVWTVPDRTGGDRYSAQIIEALPDDGTDLVVAGDFNTTSALSGTKRAFARLVAALEERGLVSAWHTVSGEAFGEERTATHAHNSRTNWHIDYIWLPHSWLPAVRSVDIGPQEHWIGPGRSDHCPITVDLDLALVR